MKSMAEAKLEAEIKRTLEFPSAEQRIKGLLAVCLGCFLAMPGRHFVKEMLIQAIREELGLTQLQIKRSLKQVEGK